jgi:trk system potassium uptake protein TrkA
VSKQVLVIGCGRFGSAVARTLAASGHEVVVADRDEAALRTVMDEVAHAAVVDATDEEALRRLGIANFDIVVVAIATDFEAGVLATVAAKEAGAEHVVAKATTGTAARVLLRVGADEVVRPEHDMGVRLAQQITTPSIVDAFMLGDDHEVIEVDVGTQEAMHGRLSKLRLPNRFGVQVIAVNRGGQLTVSPRADFEIRMGDRVVVIGEVEAVRRFERELGE